MGCYNMNHKKISLKQDTLIAIASLIVVVLYPCLFIYFQNAGEVFLCDIGTITISLAAINLLVYAIINSLYMHDKQKSALCANICMLLFLNFEALEKILSNFFPKLYYWHIVVLFLFIWFIVLVTLKHKKAQIKSVNGIILMVFSVLIMINATLSAPTIYYKVKNMQKSESEGTDNQISENFHSNIYYFIFDEYGGIDNLKRFCGFDNAPFYDRLREIGFNVSEHSQNECDSTYTVVPNLLNLDYVNYGGQINDLNDIALREEKLKKPFLFHLLLNYGYKINVLDGSDFLDKSQASFCFDASYSGVEGTAAYYILQRTALYPFYRNSSSAELQNLHEMIEYAKDSPKLADHNLFTIGYFKFPHVPWFVDEHGNPISGADRMNYYNPEIYLGEVKYANKFIEDIALAIIKEDPNSIIILQSDHGYRWTLFGPVEDDEATKMFYKRNILNSVYFRGHQVDIENKTGINTLRTVLNTLLNCNLEMISPEDYEKLREIRNS